MGTVLRLRRRREAGQVTWHAAIVLGIGDDDTIGAVSVAEHSSAQAARAWVERHLPHAQLPDWVVHRRHGAAGVFLYGQIERGFYTGPSEDDWEPDPDAPIWDADLVHGVVRWQVGD